MPGNYWPENLRPRAKRKQVKSRRSERAEAGPKGKRPVRHRPAEQPVHPRHFAFLKACANKEWPDCPQRKCRQKRKCCGGPRGVAKLRGIPACKPGRWGEQWSAEQLAELRAAVQPSSTPP